MISAWSNDPQLSLPHVDQPLERPYGARSDDAVLVGELLTQHVPELASGELEIVAIARRPGGLTKVAVRRRLRVQPPTPRPVPLVLGPRGERILAVRHALSNERVDIVQWHAEPLPYIAAALGLSYLPSAFVRAASRRVDILLGDIDYPAARGRRDLNMLLTSALTGWRVRVQPIGRSRSWRALQAAQAEHQTLVGDVVGRAPRGLRVRVYGLNALLPFGQLRNVKRHTPPAVLEAKIQHRLLQQLEVSVLRLDADAGKIIVSERVPAGRQLRLPFGDTG